ncbi:hypothetical protein P3T76_003279 [Phytophthora citrophthora]|uniref:Secreted RxLR effector peptide protein n=1 Tax=Phytophthora citrophthora TaxID=4793 RepID=A0AAD9GU87_9STRA|nr:hypothetical protein P3T76_003274 [Phytophthora citrophthora]KAK1944742.1 hypothetical protein P3T76_003275 [Phytophthora citrophthora]KAK1944743.1 hypothetical protein P3T76_003276 [Phytophthora citrophthora]KAK1944746.1 hypothetical protein P3T76_003279 [Phytophthora citrophthora]
MRLSFLLTLLVAFVVSCISLSSAANAPAISNGVRRLRLATEVEEERGIADTLAGAITSVKAKFTANSGKLVEGLKTSAQLSDDQAAKMAKILTNPEKARAAFLVSDDEIARVSTIVKKANAEVGVVDDDVATIAKVFAAAQKSAKATDDQVLAIAKIMANAKKAEAAAKAADDEVLKVSEMFKVATGRASGAAKYTDDEVAKLSKALVEAQKGAALTDNQVAKLVKMFTEAKHVSSLNDKKIGKLAQELVPVAAKDKKSWSTLKKVIVASLGITVGGAVIYGVVKLTSSPSTASSAAA